MNAADPTTMAPAERMAEIAQILAGAFQRLRAKNVKSSRKPKVRSNRLDVDRRSEAQCAAMSKVT